MIRSALAMVSIPLAARLRRPAAIALRFAAAAFVGWVAYANLPGLADGIQLDQLYWYASLTRAELMRAVALATLLIAPLAPVLGGVTMPRHSGSPLELAPLGRFARVPLRFAGAATVLSLTLLSFLPFLSVVSWLGLAEPAALFLALGFIALTACAIAAVAMLLEQVLRRAVYAYAATLFATIGFLVNSEPDGYPWLALDAILHRTVDSRLLQVISGPYGYVRPQVDFVTTIAATLGVTLIALVLADLLASLRRGRPRERGPSWSTRHALEAERRTGQRTPPWSRLPLLWVEVKRARPVFGLTLPRIAVGAVIVYLWSRSLLRPAPGLAAVERAEAEILGGALMLVLLPLAWAGSRARAAHAELQNLRLTPLTLLDRAAGLYGPALAMCGIPMAVATTQIGIDVWRGTFRLARGLALMTSLSAGAVIVSIAFSSIAILMGSPRKVVAGLLALALVAPVVGSIVTTSEIAWALHPLRSLATNVPEPGALRHERIDLEALLTPLLYHGSIAALAAFLTLSRWFERHDVAA